MKPLVEPPPDSAFVPVAEYQASTPASFALSDAPVLYLKTDGNAAGLIEGSCTLWIASDLLFLWQAARGAGVAIRYAEVLLHAQQITTNTLYIQLCGADVDDSSAVVELSLRLSSHADLQAAYNALTTCVEHAGPPPDDASESPRLSGLSDSEPGDADRDVVSASCLGEPVYIDLQTGEGDDEVLGQLPQPSSKRAAATVKIRRRQLLGKSKAPHGEEAEDDT